MIKRLSFRTGIPSAIAVITLLVSAGTAHAATTPSLGIAGTFGILSSTFTRNIGPTTITGDLGYTTLGGGGSHTITGTTHVADATYNQAGIDQGTALSALASEPCTFTFAPGAIDLATDTTHGPIGLYTPGVYCTGASSAASIGTAGITLSGAGTYIFRIDGALTSVANSNVTLANGASSCDVFWTPTGATTLGANTTFVGTDIDDAGITVGNTSVWNGRALAFGGTVTTDTDAINSRCVTLPLPPPPPSSSSCGCTPLTKTIVSDGTTTVVGDGNAVPVATSSAWTASIPGATWIWQASSTPPNATIAFEHTFTVVGTVLSAQLKIASDNSYKVFIDGVEVAADTSAINFTLATQDTHDLTAVVTPGTHTLRIEVTNIGTFDASENPAGLLYSFEIKTCSHPPPHPGNGITITIFNCGTITNSTTARSSTGGNAAGGSVGGRGGRGGDVTSLGSENNGGASAGNGGSGGNGGPGGLTQTGTASSSAGTQNDLNNTDVGVALDCACGDINGVTINVSVDNNADNSRVAPIQNHIDNTTRARARTGDNAAEGSTGGDAGVGGTVAGSGSENNGGAKAGTGGAGGGGGSGGVVVTGDATSRAASLNSLNGTRIRVGL